ncbi:hypothetical protein C2G38_1397368 [Gigaspora rosea]|uniref:Uncharacterized protein n=1 Tax=Gigaspora rosea TaxID=44941 RepID=A0A397W3A1_9GLOM|nr:hypothetical protein C2G38_1397368 [Gigaspora rosea]
MKNNGYHNNINNNKKHKYVPPNQKNDEIQDMFKVQNRQVLRKSINDDNASTNLYEFQQSTDEFQQLIDNTYILNSKQSSCFDLTSKFEGYIFDNNVIKRASKRAFTFDIDKVESKTQLNNEITKVEKCNNKLDALFKRNLIPCKNICLFLLEIILFKHLIVWQLQNAYIQNGKKKNSTFQNQTLNPQKNLLKQLRMH